jgi:hypothetical protein
MGNRRHARPGKLSQQMLPPGTRFSKTKSSGDHVLHGRSGVTGQRRRDG